MYSGRHVFRHTFAMAMSCILLCGFQLIVIWMRLSAHFLGLVARAIVRQAAWESMETGLSDLVKGAVDEYLHKRGLPSPSSDAQYRACARALQAPVPQLGDGPLPIPQAARPERFQRQVKGNRCS